MQVTQEQINKYVIEKLGPSLTAIDNLLADNNVTIMDGILILATALGTALEQHTLWPDLEKTIGQRVAGALVECVNIDIRESN